VSLTWEKCFRDGKLSIHIHLERFEGPLGLLLHLIRREEMDIFDINIHQITRQYLDYIKSMKKLNLEVAGDFIAMAATLIHIKSRMLLPQYDEEGEIDESTDPRKELVQRLLEYQKYQEAAHSLYERALVGRDVWLRGHREQFLVEKEDDEIIIEDNPLYALVTAYRAALRGFKKSIFKVGFDLQSVSSRILELRDKLFPGKSIKLSELIDSVENKSGQMLVTFLSLLELAKIGFISLFQSETYDDIHITTKKAVDRDVIARVEDYEGSVLDVNLAKSMSLGSNEILMDDEDEDDEQLDLNLEPKPVLEESIVGEEDQPFEVQAASDEEIVAEEKVLFFTAEPLGEGV